MAQRIDYSKNHFGAIKGLLEMEKYFHGSNLEPAIIELVKLRASQINGCAYCIDMHTKDARKAGETEQRLYGVTAWRETSFYNDRERAALTWTEALTLLPQNDIDDELYESVSKEFDDADLMALTAAVIAINGWNRFAVSMRTEPGSYEPK